MRLSDGESHILRNSALYPLCGRGDINLYAVFGERISLITAINGRAGCIVPSGIATDDTTKDFFAGLVENKRLVSLHHFENEDQVFPAVHHAFRFCLLTLGSADAADFVFYARQIEHLHDDARKFQLTARDFDLLNPNSRTCPTFRSRADAELNKAIYRRSGVMVRETMPASDPWSVRFLRMIDMANDSNLFRERKSIESEGLVVNGNVFGITQPEYLPLYEAKMIHHFDHRFGTYDGQTTAQENQGKLPELDETMHADASLCTQPYYWVSAAQVAERLHERWNRKWLLVWRDICRSTDRRTTISTIVPLAAVGHTTPCFIGDDLTGELAACLQADWASYAFDYSARQKIGGTHLTYGFLKQLPVLPPATYAELCPWASDPNSEIPNPPSLRDWLLPRVLELTYTAWDLEAFATDCGWSGPPFRWDEERRFLLRCELDAAFFHLYLGPQSDWQQQPEALTHAFPTPRHAVSYIMDTFPIVKRKEETKHAHFRTKETILQIYDALGQAMQTGVAYQTLLNPAPAHPSCCHPPRDPKADQISVEIPNWQDGVFTLLAPKRKKVHNYRLAVWPELIRQWDKNLEFETFRKAYWLLSEPTQFESEGRKLFPELPAAWWKSRKESLATTDFIPTLKGSATIGDVKIWREGGIRHIRWTGTLPESLVHEVVDDTRIALQIASQWSDDVDQVELVEIETLLQTLEFA